MKSIVLRTILFSFVLTMEGLVNMQAQTGTWKNYSAYHNATIVVETPHLVFAVYDGSLMSYNPKDEEIRTYSNKDGLNGVDIRHMAYCPEANALVLVYSNSNIDIFLRENEVYNLSYILDKNYPDKTVNNLELIGEYAHLSTAFGIVVVDVKKREIKNTYDTGANTKSVCRRGDYLYAATTDWIKKGSVSSNLLDPKNWEAADDIGNDGENLHEVKKILVHNDRFYFIIGYYTYYLSDNGKIELFTWEYTRDISIVNNQLFILTDHVIYLCPDLYNKVQIPINAYSIDCKNTKNQYWVAAGYTGLTAITKQVDSSEFSVNVSGININSPKRNLNFYMTYTADKLLIVGGGRGADRFNIEGTFMIYENGRWFNFDENEISEKTGLPCMDFTSVAVDPRDPEHYFVSSWGEGVYEFQNKDFVQLYSLGNSSLTSAIQGHNQYVRTDGLVFDKKNNLHVANADRDVQNGLSILNTQNEWESFYVEPLASAQLNRILISKKGQKWFNIWRLEKSGIVVLDENNALISSAKFFTDQQGGDFNVVNYLSMAEDLTGSIWVGTDNGPIYFSSAEQVGTGICNRIVLTDEHDEGFHPLEGLKITAIAVDGANRKWMGTDNSGLFVMEQSGGSIVIENYTVDNSYLISNTINSIAINDKTGEIFVGTDKGLCSYMGEATSGKADYSTVHAFPNPVRPARDSQVVISGLMQNSTVKITDMAGNLIKEGSSLGGQFIWNCTDRYETTVKAGIYLVFAATPTGNQGVVTKIMVIK